MSRDVERHVPGDEKNESNLFGDVFGSPTDDGPIRLVFRNWSEMHQFSVDHCDVACQSSTTIPTSHPDREVKSVPRSSSRAEDDDQTGWSKWDSPAEWAKVLGLTGSRAFIRRCAAGKIVHQKMDDKTYRLAISELPASARETLG